LLIVFTCGMSLILSIVRLYFKDIQSIWGIVVVSLIFITPVFWHVDELPQNISQIFLLNPLAVIMEMGHEVILYQTIPSFEDAAYSVVTSFATLLVGWILFKKFERKIVEKL
ncbi:MAG: ABC transporter permease, partial [Thaumarchaeota archaeon]|nr:ABC transporter permease [Nitrososphaerota archaeon]